MSFGKKRTYKDPFEESIKYTSVTTILNVLNKSALMYWSVNCACDYILENMSIQHSIAGIVETARKEWRNVQKKALDIGTEVHEAIHKYLTINKEPEITNPKVLAAFVAFLEWKDANKLVPIECEKVVYGKGYAGTADLICMLNGKSMLIDFKSSKDIYNEYIYQVAAYAQAYNSNKTNGKIYVEGIGILRLDKETGQPEYKDVTDKWSAYYEAFEKLVEFYNVQDKL